MDAEDSRDQLVFNAERFIMLAATAFAKPRHLNRRFKTASIMKSKSSKLSKFSARKALAD
jgi:hypothetical protein